jgi:DNA repair ATPase RecN
MLSLIRVKSYAVIDEIAVEFAGGFNVMTGVPCASSAQAK